MFTIGVQLYTLGEINNIKYPGFLILILILSPFLHLYIISIIYLLFFFYWELGCTYRRLHRLMNYWKSNTCVTAIHVKKESIASPQKCSYLCHFLFPTLALPPEGKPMLTFILILPLSCCGVLYSTHP